MKPQDHVGTEQYFLESFIWVKNFCNFSRSWRRAFDDTSTPPGLAPAWEGVPAAGPFWGPLGDRRVLRQGVACVSNE